MNSNRRLSRRRMLKHGAAVASAGAALLADPSATALGGQAPAVITTRKFKAWISRGDGPGRTTLQDVTLRPIRGRQVVVRTEAPNLCHSERTAGVRASPHSSAIRPRRRCSVSLRLPARLRLLHPLWLLLPAPGG